ncbi:MAG: vWA domain-containing protein [Cyanobacteria bacterium P01_H01_bin.74]
MKNSFYRAKSFGMGSHIMLTFGMVLLTVMASTLAIDMGWYFTAQNQLQTATDAAALTAGAKMFEGEADAESAALAIAEANGLNGLNLGSNNFNFNFGAGNLSVQAQSTVPTVMAKVLCGLSGKAPGRLVDGQAVEDRDGDGNPDATDGCSYMTVYAKSHVIGSPRDTVLVIDTSSSMDSLGYGQPFLDVKDASQAFLDMIVEMEESHPDSVDKVALVQFDKTASLVNTFLSTKDSPGLTMLKNQVAGMQLYAQSGWCTNYESGLKVALDELESNAREGAHKNIIFFTDGEPNLPDGVVNISHCLYYKYWGLNNTAKACTQNYVNHMMKETNEQIARAKAMNVTVHTIKINDPSHDSGSLETLRWLLNDFDWEPGLVEGMANETQGEQFAAEAADTDAIMEVFRSAAKIVDIKLAPYPDSNTI